MNDFVMHPRQIRYDFVDRKLTLTEYLALKWIFDNTNPVNGRFEVSYDEFAEVLELTETNARKVLWKLRKNKYVWYANHQGKGGKFAVYPIGFERTDKRIHIWEDFEIGSGQATQSQVLRVPESQPKNNFNPSNHKSNVLKSATTSLNEQFSMDKRNRPITSLYTETKTENNTDKIDEGKIQFKPIPVATFKPNTSEENFCLEFAQEIGEENMNSILKTLGNHGLGIIQRVRGIYREVSAEHRIENPPAYVNSLIRKVLEMDKNGNINT
jgi:hypothetical protein